MILTKANQQDLKLKMIETETGINAVEYSLLGNLLRNLFDLLF
jgi:hypothetical protein